MIQQQPEKPKFLSAFRRLQSKKRSSSSSEPSSLSSSRTERSSTSASNTSLSTKMMITTCVSLALFLASSHSHNIDAGSIVDQVVGTATAAAAGTVDAALCDAGNNNGVCANQQVEQDDDATTTSSSSTKTTSSGTTTKGRTKEASSPSSQYEAYENYVKRFADDMGVPQGYGEMKYVPVIDKRVDAVRRYRANVASAGYADQVSELCINQDEWCMYWAATGECENNAAFMMDKCAPTCFQCRSAVCSSAGDNQESCNSIVQKAEDEFKKAFAADTADMNGEDDDLVQYDDEEEEDEEEEEQDKDGLGSDIGVVQEYGATAYRDEVVVKLAETRAYLEELAERYGSETSRKLRRACRNKNPLCTYWAVTGQCETNEAFMELNCSPVCGVCEQSHAETRCIMDPDAQDAFPEPGDLNHMFENIISNEAWVKEYDISVVSRPDLAPGDTAETATYKVGGPWMLVFDKLATPEEAQRLIELGGLRGYMRSKDVGTEKEDGTFDEFQNDGRTSTQAWCQEECYEDPVPQRVTERMCNITGLPEENAEYLQMLRYEKTQFYHIHNDYIDHQKFRPCGVRVLTFYIYLSDVEEGGETEFPNVLPKEGVVVKPKAGRAVLWPSILNESPHDVDRRTDHTALPVIKGTKFGANAWFHQRDFKTPLEESCV